MSKRIHKEDYGAGKLSFKGTPRFVDKLEQEVSSLSEQVCYNNDS